MKFDVDGVQHTRLRFYIEGPHRKAIVLTELKQVLCCDSTVLVEVYMVLLCGSCLQHILSQ